MFTSEDVLNEDFDACVCAWMAQRGWSGAVVFPIRELRVSGVSGWESSEIWKRTCASEPAGSACLTRPLALATPVQDEARGAAMLYRRYFLHYRLIREAITAVATIGTALLFSYLILQARF